MFSLYNFIVVALLFLKRKNRTNPNEQAIFLHINFFTSANVMSATEGIEPIALRLRSQCLAADLCFVCLFFECFSTAEQEIN